MSDHVIDAADENDNNQSVELYGPWPGVLCLFFLGISAFIGRISGIDGPRLWFPLAFLLAISLSETCVSALPLSDRCRRRTLVSLSLLAGIGWGSAALSWYAPTLLPNQILLTFVISATITAKCFIRLGDRTLVLATALPALIPLIVRLAVNGDSIHLVLSILVCGLLLSLSMVWLANARRLNKLTAQVRTSRQEAETALTTAAEAAAEQARQNKRFIASISHELRTPFNALLGMAQLLDRADLPQPQRGQARIILEAGRSFQTLLDDISVLATDGSNIDTHGESDPAAITRSVARLLQPVAWEKHLHLSANIATDLPRIALGPHALRQALLKLIGNALNLTTAGNITITVEAAQRNALPLVRFTVTDTGLGISPEVASELFRNVLEDGAEYARSTTQSGTSGLGVAKKIVETAGGEIGFETQLGEGSAFWFTIPALATGQSSPEISDNAASPVGLRLLVCLEDVGQLRTISNILEPGNQLEVARDPANLVTRATREAFDAIITTVEFGDMLAAAPGKKAPVLMLKTIGQNVPSLGQYLIWPCPPSALYQALRTLQAISLDKSGDTAEKTETAHLIDNGAITDLEKSVGETTLIEILRAYLENTDNICAALEVAAKQGQWEDVGRHARDIAGSASGLGLSAMTASARAFTAAVRAQAGDAALQQASEHILEDHHATHAALLALYPELDQTGQAPLTDK